MIHFLLTFPLKKRSKFCTGNLFRNNDIVHGLKKSEFKELLSFATKEMYFIFNNILCKQNDGVALGSSLEILQKKWLSKKLD